jgi:hypothetical protein
MSNSFLHNFPRARQNLIKLGDVVRI